jgi:hypothetical protein
MSSKTSPVTFATSNERRQTCSYELSVGAHHADAEDALSISSFQERACNAIGIQVKKEVHGLCGLTQRLLLPSALRTEALLAVRIVVDTANEIYLEEAR